jgi:hypothetical protein
MDVMKLENIVVLGTAGIFYLVGSNPTIYKNKKLVSYFI